ncbi:MAG: putative AlkP superfamily pyrophosphatase or phosphodiesterase [Roseivirga sp.]|jgi:predicted AlkP superfamily pyrophosphatase or phosphodiesterase
MSERGYFYINKAIAMKKYFASILLLLFSGFVSVAKTCENKQEPPYVIMISFDGFKYDYVEKFNPPNFKEFIKTGASAEAMIPSFPSKTFPNHYTLVTGLYPGHHGLVDNSFYDKKLDMQYGIRNRSMVENSVFYGGLPLWQLVQQNGMKSASYFWVGSETSIAGSFPNYYHIYSDDVKNEERITAVIDWLKLPESERPNFISLYFSLVDSQGHRTGPNSEETKQTVLEADRLLGLLMTELRNMDLPVNVIITSDHGMNEIQPKEENLISYQDVLSGLDPNQFRFVSNGAHAHLYLKDKANIENVFRSLKAKENHFKVLKKEEFPAVWHYQNDRVGDIMIVIDADHYLTSADNKTRQIAAGVERGEHGFDPYTTEDMGAIFYANGPNIKPGSKLPKFENVNVYPLVAHILGITELPKIDGKLKVLKSIYKR